MKNNHRFIAIAVFMIFNEGCIFSSIHDNDFFDLEGDLGNYFEPLGFFHEMQDQNNAGNASFLSTPSPTQNVYEECILSVGWEISNEIEDDGNLENVFEPVQERHSNESIPLLTDIQEAGELLEPKVKGLIKSSVLTVIQEQTAEKKYSSQRLKKQPVFFRDEIIKGSFDKKEIKIDDIIKPDANIKNKQRESQTIRRRRQIEALKIVKQNKLSQYSLEQQEIIKIDANRYQRKKELDRSYIARRKKNLEEQSKTNN